MNALQEEAKKKKEEEAAAKKKGPRARQEVSSWSTVEN